MPKGEPPANQYGLLLCLRQDHRQCLSLEVASFPGCPYNLSDSPRQYSHLLG
jgi:hypothetical protein